MIVVNCLESSNHVCDLSIQITESKKNFFSRWIDLELEPKTVLIWLHNVAFED